MKELKDRKYKRETEKELEVRRSIEIEEKSVILGE